MKTLRGAVVGALILGMTAVIPPVNAQAAAPTAPYTALFLDNGRGTWLGGAHTLDPSNSTMALSTIGSGATSDRLTFTVTTSDQRQWSVQLESPMNGRFAQGTTYPTAYQGGTTTATLNITIDGMSCSPMPGSMTVAEVGRDATTDVIDVFAASFVLNTQCNNTAGPNMNGELRWHSSVGYRAAETGPAQVAFGVTDVGKTAAKKITVTSTGSQPTTFGAASIGGTTPAAFAVTQNDCDGVTLGYGETCTVSVTARPTDTGDQLGQLTLVDDTVSGKKIVGLTVTGTTGATGTYYPLYPERLLDTRTGTGAPKAKVGEGGTINLQVTGRGGVPASGVSAVVLNVTVTQPTKSGYVTAWPSGVTRPTASSLNFVAGLTRANSVTVPVGANGKVSLFNSAGTSHLLADVVGFYAGNNDVLGSWGLGGQLFPHTPGRVFDTRDPFPGYPHGAKMPADYEFILPFEYNGVVDPHIRAVVANITATEPASSGYLTTWNGNGSAPNASTLNFVRGKTVSNMAIIPVRQCGMGYCPSDYEYDWLVFGLKVNRDTHVIVDIVAYLDDSTLAGGRGLRFKPNTPTRITDTRADLGAGKLGNTTVAIQAPAPLADADTIALALNVTAISPTTGTYLTIWPNGITRPTTSNLNPSKGDVVPNAAITGVDDENKFAVYNNAGTVNVVIDLVGTFYLWSGAAAFSAQYLGAQALTKVPGPATLTPLAPGTWRTS